MHVIQIQNIKKISTRRKILERKLNIKIKIKNKNVILEGDEINQYITISIFEAIDKGFEVEQALLLIDPNYILENINVKELTRRKNISQVRARIIGTKGRTLKVLSELTNCHIILHGNQVFIIGPSERIKDAINGLKKLIHGSKQSSTYSYLERARKNPRPLDLGLKTSKFSEK